jgi:hypothetical protein
MMYCTVGNNKYMTDSRLRHEVVENCAILGFYAVSSGNWRLKTEQIGWPETSVRNYHYSLRNDLEDGSSQKYM